MRLLVVDDNPDIRELLIELLEGAGYDAAGAGSVSEAVAALAAARYDLLILDLRLPDGDGTLLLRLLRRRGSLMPVIVCTGRSDATLCADLLDEGADAYLDKPFSCNELLARVRALLRRTRPAQPHPAHTAYC